LFLLLTCLRRYASIAWLALTAPFTGDRRIGGALLLLAGLPVFIAWQLLHWLGFLIDEIVFRGYRKVEIREPVFIIGPPRTGTTYLHQVLSQDEQTTTFHAWECLFGLSVTGRKLCLALAAADRAIGRPAARLVEWVGRRSLASMDDIHPLELDTPEEDFLALMPLAACFLLVVPLPAADWLWRIARLDVAATERERRALMRYYRRCIRKHLYVFGTDRRFLSKNASFAGLSETLLEAFPDARILATVRDPLASVPSQLSSIRPALATCGFPQVSPALRDRFVDLLVFYYDHLMEVATRHPERLAFITNDDMRDRLDDAVTSAMRQVGLPISDSLAATLTDAARRSRRHRSAHEYSLEEFGLTEDLLRSRFANAYDYFGFDVDDALTGNE